MKVSVFRSSIITFAIAVAGMFSFSLAARAATPVATQTTLTISPSATVAVGTTVKFSVAVTAAGKGVNPGQVLLCNADAPRCADAAILGRAQLTYSGTAALRLRLGAGSYNIRAQFLGVTQTTSHNPEPRAASTSPTVALTVTGPTSIPTSTSLNVSGSLGVYSLAGTVITPGNVKAGGSVSFLDSAIGNASLGSIPLSAGTSGVNLPSPLPFQAGFDPIQVVSADFNHDGIPDLVVVNQFDTSVTVYLGVGDGSYTAMPSIPLERYVGSAGVADFNSDGNPDIVLTASPCCEAIILLGKGDGTFVEGVGDGASNGDGIPAIGDFNGDGIADIALIYNDRVSVILGKNDGTFQNSIFATLPGQVSALVTGDFNGDGILDLAATIGFGSATSPGTVSILLGNGDGTFNLTSSIPVGKDASAIAVADLNGDGFPDLAVADANEQSVSILLGDGTGAFAVHSSYKIGASGTNGSGFVIADFNHDGIPDIALSSYATAITFLLGNGDGTFGLTSFPLGMYNYAQGLTAADLNSDGIPDLAVLNSSGVDVYLTQPTVTATLANVTLQGGGIHNITASYSGDSLYQPSVSAPVALNNTTATPVILPGSGGFASPLQITIIDSTPGAAIYYTLDGSIPGTGSNLYAGPITLSGFSTATLNAIAIGPNFAPSSIASATYTSVLPTQISLGIAPGASVTAGTPVTLAAYVTANGSAFHGGTVLFCKTTSAHCEGSALLGASQVGPGGYARLHLRLGIGTYNIYALFQATPRSPIPHASSSSAPQSLTVKGRESTLTAAAIATPVAGGYTLVSRVAAFGRQPISGTLAFTDSLNGASAIPLGSDVLSPSGTTISFSASKSFDTLLGGETTAAVGDFNRDGIPDIVTGSYYNGAAILYGNGDGTFRFAFELVTPGYSAAQVFAADFNGDGIDDVLVTMPDAPGGVILLGKADGSFAPAIAVPSIPQSVVIADFNGDGILDIAFANGQQVTVLPGKGDGTFNSGISTNIPLSALSVVAADFNGDGIVDLAFSSGNSIGILLGTGGGTFYLSATINTGNLASFAASDLNNDGLADLAVVPSAPGPSPCAIYLASAGGTFTLLPPLPQSAPQNFQSYSVTVADFNGDGKPDLVIGYIDNSPGAAPGYPPLQYVQLLLGAGDGTFPRSSSPKQATLIPGVPALDANGDGIPDLLTQQLILGTFYGATDYLNLYTLLGDQVTTGALHNITLAPGTHVITPSYSGSAALAPSIGPPITIAVP